MPVRTFLEEFPQIILVSNLNTKSYENSYKITVRQKAGQMTIKGLARPQGYVLSAVMGDNGLHSVFQSFMTRKRQLIPPFT